MIHERTRCTFGYLQKAKPKSQSLSRSHIRDFCAIQMKTKILIVISALTLGTACRSLSGLKKSYQYEPSNVTWNGRSANKLIENRFPVYGVVTVIDGIATSNGGCTKRQFSMDVVTENEKTIIGDIKDSESGEPAHFAVVIFYQVNQTDTVNAVFDGKFTHTIHTELERIEVNNFGYETLVLNIPKKW